MGEGAVSKDDRMEFLQFRRFGIISPPVQMLTIAVLYMLTTALFAQEVHATGSMDGFPPDVWILFVPITEEILFRGFILKALEIAYGKVWAVIGSSALFGLWHFKNIFWEAPVMLEQQMIYTALIFGPIMAIIVLKFRTIWPCVILHYLNNFPPGLGKMIHQIVS
jgi:membrane protease YdiL (CAAX protease family)